MTVRLVQGWVGALAVHAGIAATTLAMTALAMTTGAQALSIELKDVAADRVERQRAAAEGALPLPGTPNVAILGDRLRDKGVSLAAPILIRIFKSESELEIWKEKDGAFLLFATYPICHWSGTLGPKLRMGDKQAPEGFYTVTRPQIHHSGRWPKSLNIGFPNVLDQSQARTGSDILIHGGCSSIGCFAMTNPVMDEIHLITSTAIDGGQEHVPVHVYPFRMTEANMLAHAASPWFPFWANMKGGYDAFDAWNRPPVVSICDGRYGFRQAPRGTESGALDPCAPTLTVIRDQDQWLRDVPAPSNAPILPKPEAPPPAEVQTQLGNGKQTELIRRPAILCDLDRASCRHHVAQLTKMADKRARVAERQLNRRNGAPRPQS